MSASLSGALFALTGRVAIAAAPAVELGMLCNAKREDGAVTVIKSAVVASPELAGAHYQLSLTYRRMGETGKTERELKP